MTLQSADFESAVSTISPLRQSEGIIADGLRGVKQEILRHPEKKIDTHGAFCYKKGS